MRLDEAIRVVRDQTIPALRGSGGDGHAEALEVILSEVERLKVVEADARSDDGCSGDGYRLGQEVLTLRAEVKRLKGLNLEQRKTLDWLGVPTLKAKLEQAEVALQSWAQGEKGYQCAACAILAKVLEKGGEG